MLGEDPEELEMLEDLEEDLEEIEKRYVGELSARPFVGGRDRVL